MGSSAAPLGILAGAGTLPRRLAEAAAAQSRKVFIVAFEGQADPATVDGFDHAWVRLGHAGRILAELKKAGAVDLVMAGAVRRPSISDIGLDWRGARLFASIGARAIGDDTLLRAVARELELEGFRLVGANDVMAGGFVEKGPLGRHAPDAQAMTDIARGFEVARMLGMADVGQSVVVQQGLVLGVEAIEGTDGLLERAGLLRRGGPGGVLVKSPKPQQDLRLDLPTIGPGTIARAAAAGLRGVAIAAGGVIVLDQSATIAAADAAGLFLFADEPESTGNR